MTRLRIVILLSLGVAVSSGFALADLAQRPVSPRQVYHAHSFRVQPPATYTEAEETAYSDAVANGDPLPSGWTKIEEQGEVNASLTGVCGPLHWTEELHVTVRDDSAHLETAKVYMNDELVGIADRATGQIADADGSALARMSVFVPRFLPCKLEVRWKSLAGVESSQSVRW